MSAISQGRLGALVGAAAMLAGVSATAAPGDVHRVTNADRVNLRAAPSDGSNVRGTVERGDEVIELTRDDSWFGVRVLRTGEEGWIFGQLLDPVARSTLGNGGPPPIEDVGFQRFSPDFNRLIRSINADFGYPVVQEVEQPEADLLHVRPSGEWLLYGSREAHVMAAAAMYQMWKNHQNGAPVRVVMVDSRGQEYITIVDGQEGPNLSIASPQSG